MIVDHGGDSSHERHPGRHVQVKMAGLGHPEMEARERQTGCGYAEYLNRAAQALGLGLSTQWGPQDSGTAPHHRLAALPGHITNVLAK